MTDFSTFIRPVRIGGLTLAHNLFLAPMAGITNMAFRIICRRHGAAMAFTEMVSVNGMVREGERTVGLLKSCDEDRPLGVQIFGSDADTLAEAARMAEGFGDLLDINMGCPVRKVVATGAGSAFLKDAGRIRDVVRSVRRATAKPFTIKIRSGWSSDQDVYLEAGRIAQEEGCDAIAFHPRSRTQMFSGKADREKLANLKAALSIPVIGSGDLFSPEDCLSMLAETSCDAVMVARGALGNPWIFDGTVRAGQGGETRLVSPEAIRDVMHEHFTLFSESEGEMAAFREMKKHVGWYVRGFPGASELRRRANNAASPQDIQEVIDAVAGLPQKECRISGTGCG